MQRIQNVVLKDSYHHDPDQEEGIANKNEENGKFTHIEVNTIGLKERAVLDNILSSAGVIGRDPESYPDSHVEHWAPWTVEYKRQKP